MARNTRSAIGQRPDSSSTPKSPLKASKKRKRPSEEGDLSPGETSVKSEDLGDEDEHPSFGHSSAGNLPIDSVQALQILDVLEMIDTQGLLDRVFPLSASETSKAESCSLRKLLEHSSEYPLSSLRASVQHLFPITSSQRSISTPAAQQLRFCNLALSLLDQASLLSSHIPLEASEIPSPSSSFKEPHPKRFALMQRLASGDWWTSLNNNYDGAVPMKELSTSHAELVAIVPSTLPLTIEQTTPLGSIAPQPVPTGVWTRAIQRPRKTGVGVFLDYGPFTSFAPCFQRAGAEIGRRALGETMLRWEAQRDRKEDIISALEQADIEDTSVIDPLLISEPGSVDAGVLEGLLSPTEVNELQKVKLALDDQDQVAELLERNRRAIVRLDELQTTRLVGSEGHWRTAQEGSEEWDLAETIHESFVALQALRPRAVTASSSKSPFVPSASALRALHRSLPVHPNPGWRGALPPNRPIALRDDMTVRQTKSTRKDAWTNRAAAIPIQSVTAPAMGNASGGEANYAPYYYTPAPVNTGKAVANTISSVKMNGHSASPLPTTYRNQVNGASFSARR